MTATLHKKPAADFDLPAAHRKIDAAHAAVLKAANINPKTGLATDYLNHFNEAIMLAISRSRPTT
jgi:hypothetical protein